MYDIYPLQGKANQQLTIAVESKQFDTVLAVVDEEYNVIEQNDDIDKSTKNSALTVTLPKDGTYYVIVNAYDNSGRGQYSLTIR
ncbi:MAG: hypothetical protein HC890_16375 [Chloroflexaceae bacterium]|nr:hypothetical protein [Chloroflexaceae bacterium]